MTELVFILDRSGSMAGLEADTIGGFNSMIAKQKKEAGEALVSTVLFANDSTVIHDRLPLSEVPPLTEKEYFTCGCTALLDTVGGAIHHIGNIHKYARREDVPEKTMFIITTDGYENASRRYSYETVQRMIERQKTKYGWEFPARRKRTTRAAITLPMAGRSLSPQRGSKQTRNSATASLPGILTAARTASALAKRCPPSRRRKRYAMKKCPLRSKMLPSSPARRCWGRIG